MIVASLAGSKGHEKNRGPHILHNDIFKGPASVADSSIKRRIRGLPRLGKNL
jgi:hypothetical protein